MYRQSPDPWRYVSDPYELGRYHHIVSLLGADPFAFGFEPACSIGVLTTMLASRGRKLVATDISSVAVERARIRCATLEHVDIRQGRLPDDMPDGPLDLVVLSEVGYYFEVPALVAVLDRLADRMAPDGLLVAAHWTGTSRDHVLPGSKVHEVLARSQPFRETHCEHRPGYLIGTYRREGRSTAHPGVSQGVG